MGGHAIVAAQLPIAVGLALASQYRAEDSVVLCFFGDGAVNEGEFHESLNLASLWKLPVLFFLENNLYGMGSHIDQTHAAGRDIYTAAEYYKIPAVQIDGMDLMAVRESTMEALTQVRSGTGPVFLEAMTYRYRGHSMADPEAYRETSELDEWRANDPIERFKTFALAEALISEEELAEIEKDAADAIDEAVTFAQESPDPEMGSLYDNVYA
jgi:pyruvate dehydrogenase E1 component alpha subunit